MVLQTMVDLAGLKNTMVLTEPKTSAELDTEICRRRSLQN